MSKQLAGRNSLKWFSKDYFVCLIRGSIWHRARVIDPPELVPNKGPSACVSFEPPELTEFGSEAKESFMLWSENGEVGVSSLESPRSRQKAAALPGSPHSAGGGGVTPEGAAPLLMLQVAAPGQQLHACPVGTILNRGVALGASAHGLLCWGVGAAITPQKVWPEGPVFFLCKRPPMSKWRYSKHKGQKKKKGLDFILLPRLYFYFPGIVNGLCQWPLHI